jgi:hypothetical protein
MARTSPAEKLTRIRAVLAAWLRLGRRDSFWGMTLTQFRAAVQPSIDAREEIEDLQQRLRVAIRKRNAADAHTFKLISGVGAAVRGNPNHGMNSALYEAMGFTREATRVRNIRRGRRRNRKEP